MNGTEEKKTVRVLHHYVIKLDILREEALPDDLSIDEIVRDGIDGPASMDWHVSKHALVSEKQAIKICRAHQMQLSFFGLEDECESGG
jgi:hypothetical protein